MTISNQIKGATLSRLRSYDAVTGRVVALILISERNKIHPSRFIALFFLSLLRSTAVLDHDEDVLVTGARRLEVRHNQLSIRLGAETKVLELSEFKFLSWRLGVAK